MWITQKYLWLWKAVWCYLYFTSLPPFLLCPLRHPPPLFRAVNIEKCTVYIFIYGQQLQLAWLGVCIWVFCIQFSPSAFELMFLLLLLLTKFIVCRVNSDLVWLERCFSRLHLSLFHTFFVVLFRVAHLTDLSMNSINEQNNKKTLLTILPLLWWKTALRSSHTKLSCIIIIRVSLVVICRYCCIYILELHSV